jgi:hypothetical protein
MLYSISPEMEHAGMPVTDGFLARRFFVDGIQRLCNFDQLLAVGHEQSFK